MKKNQLIDCHAHICSYADVKLAKQEIEYRKKNGIRTCFSAGTPLEWEYLNQLIDPEKISFGIHPWYADQWEPATWMELYQKCRFVGEIGMDTLWCDVPIEQQRKVFASQLRIAADLHKPVILHTKNCEAEIAETITGFPGQVLVHWYSGDEKTLWKLIDQNCFFTLGPDTSLKSSLLLKNVPADRLLTETDGIKAIRWAYKEAGENTVIEGFPLIDHTLQATLRCYAERFGMDEETAGKTICDIYGAFIGDDRR